MKDLLISNTHKEKPQKKEDHERHDKYCNHSAFLYHPRSDLS
jgi:hypothetical protein